MALWTFPNGERVRVKDPYYAASCDQCGWQGSSEECGTDSWGDDSDVYCPKCFSSGCCSGKAAARAALSSAPGGEGGE